MRKLILYLVVLQVTLASCSTYYTTSKALSDLPSRSHTNRVDVYVSGERIPYKYVKIEAVEIESYVFQTTFPEWIDVAQKETQKIGGDAIILVNQVEAIAATEAGPQGRRGKLHFFAIKYVKNINHLEGYVKSKKLLQFNNENNTYEEEANLNFTSRGKLKSCSNPNSIYFTEFEPYGTEHLIYEESKFWESSTDKNGLVAERVYSKNNKWLKRCKITYNTNSQPERIWVYHRNSTVDIISFEYNSTHVLLKKQIHFHDQQRRIFNYNYDNSGRLTSVDVDSVENKQEKPYAKLEVIYYNNEDLNSLL